MSETAELKTMPLASVIYVVTFDAKGMPIVQAKIHTDTAGRARFEGDAGKAYTMLFAGLEATAKRVSLALTDQLVRTIEEKRLLQTELDQPPTAISTLTATEPPELPAAGEIF